MAFDSFDADSDDPLLHSIFELATAEELLQSNDWVDKETLTNILASENNGLKATAAWESNNDGIRYLNPSC